jgi:oligoribonuclease NrnB/cAMP/cGMP phosphodiesterase (DHH superfamily)
MVGLNYGQAVPWELLKGAEVALLDFCLQPFGDFVRLLQIARSVTWIDHHKSAIAAWEESELPAECCPLTTLLDTTRAACELTWEFYRPEAPIPRGVFLLGDYDAWRHSDEDTMRYQMGLRLYDMDPVNESAMTLWRMVFNSVNHDVFYGDVLRQGDTILSYQKQQNEKSVKAMWFPVNFEGRRWMGVNQGGINSTFWDAVWSESFDGKLGFVRFKDHWTVSLYSETLDCSEIARRHGGGGHRGAAGFQCQELPFTFSVS